MFTLHKKIDFILLFSLTGLLVMGLLALYSSSHTTLQEGTGSNYFLKQMFWMGLGLFLMFIIFFIPHRWLFNASYAFYGVSILFLLMVVFFGKLGQGAERWLQIGPLSFQPSELAKLATILAVSRYISRDDVDLNQLKDFLIVSGLIFLPFLLIIRQPDLGTAMVFAAMALPMFYWAGLKPSNLFLIIIPFLIILASFQFFTFLILMLVLVIYLIYSRRSKLVFIFNFILNIIMGLLTPILWSRLKPYQQNRIRIFLNPETDPRGAGYQIIQSKVAIGSGGSTGKGFMQGSQTQLRFLPEQHTDFIYAVIGEEFGFIGVCFGIILFLGLLVRGVQIAAVVRNRFNSIVAIGIVTVIAFHVVINLGMTVGLLPVTGLPLPFVSYGGSSLVTNMIMVGILLNFYKNRFEY